jgi:hypothetical protein
MPVYNLLRYSVHTIYYVHMNEHEKEVMVLSDKAEALIIKDAKDMESASSLLSILNRRRDQITEEKEKVTKPLNEALKAERSRWKPIEMVLDTHIDDIRSRMSAYQTEQSRIAKEEEAKIASRIKPGKGNLSLDTALEKMDAINTPEEKVTTDNGSVSFRTDKRLKITDETKIPRHYLIVNEKLLLEDLKKGVAVYGAEIEEVKTVINKR